MTSVPHGAETTRPTPAYRLVVASEPAQPDQPHAYQCAICEWDPRWSTAGAWRRVALAWWDASTLTISGVMSVDWQDVPPQSEIERLQDAARAMLAGGDSTSRPPG